MAKIYIKKLNKSVLVDDEDYDKLSKYSWNVAYSHDSKGKVYWNNYYFRTKIKGKHIMMHRYILGVTDSSVFVDHINHNLLDNRKSNLRLCNNRQNMQNSRIGRNKGVSSYKGVGKHGSKWSARISNENGQRVRLGSFNTPIEAARAYDKAALQYHGEFAYLNFPIR